MKKVIGLPIEDLNSINDITPENTTINMSDLSFPVEDDKQNNAALLFIRNMNITADFYFDSCSYETKSWFLLAYLKKVNFELNIKSLTDTWIHILSDGYLDRKCIPNHSIFSDEDIKRFCEENKDYIFELRRFIVSIPLVSINHFKDYLVKKNYKNLDISEFDCSQYEHSSFNMINMGGFINILKDDIIVTLQQVITDIEPIWYMLYFDSSSNNYYSDLINLFPYLDILNIMTPDNESLRDMFTDEMNKLLDSKIEKPENSD